MPYRAVPPDLPTGDAPPPPPCSICTSPTERSFALGTDPLCESCWRRTRAQRVLEQHEQLREVTRPFVTWLTIVVLVLVAVRAATLHREAGPWTGITLAGALLSLVLLTWRLRR